MWCCAFVPVIVIVGLPAYVAGRGGMRPFVLAFVFTWGLVLLGAGANWRAVGPLWVVIAGAMVLSASIGTLVAWAKWDEERVPDRNRCRRCGYDLRASPERCPECGTPVRPGPEGV